MGRDTELYRILNMHYNKSNVYQVRTVCSDTAHIDGLDSGWSSGSIEWKLVCAQAAQDYIHTCRLCHNDEKMSKQSVFLIFEVRTMCSYRLKSTAFNAKNTSFLVKYPLRFDFLVVCFTFYDLKCVPV